MEDDSLVQAMRYELDQFEINQVQILIERPKNCSFIRTKWVLRNKMDEHEKVILNDARLVAQVYLQQECIDYNETFDPVARLESIRISLAYASFNTFF